MPRIVPLQLLKCLRVLLDENGGILGPTEVPRIAGLMTKYSKKLVSKCIYVQILKSTKTELLDEFMSVGGWSLTYTWLNDSIRAMNWPLVQEILELLLLSPVDVIRLKINSAPKLVKGLCKDGGNEGVRILAKRLVEQWLKIVTEQSGAILSRPATTVPIKSQTQPLSLTDCEIHPDQKNSSRDDTDEHKSKEVDTVTDISHNTLNYTITSGQRKANNKSGLVFKFVVNDGQQTLKQVEKQVTDNKNISNAIEDNVLRNGSNIFVNDTADVQNVELKGKSEGKNTKTIEEYVEKKHKNSRSKDKKTEKEREKERKSTSHKSSSSSNKSSSTSKSYNSSKNSASNDKHRDREKDRLHISSKEKERRESSSSTSSSTSSKHKLKQSSSSFKERNGEKDRDKSQTSSSKKNKEQDKDNKLMPPPVMEKRSKEDVELQKPKSITIPSRKASISIEIRRETDKAKTVKTFNSQFRSHGLTEEAPRPPSRKDLKKSGTSGSVILSSQSLKRTSPPPKESHFEKKAKIDMNLTNGLVEKPGAIKLIPPKKIQMLVETNIFSDALSASIEPKKIKRKRPVSASPSKDVSISPDATKLTPLKFYQDTLDESKNEEKSSGKDDSLKENDSIEEPEKLNPDEDDDLPLKKVKEDIEKKVQKEKSLVDNTGNDLCNKNDENIIEKEESRKPGPGCGPDGPPGVLMLHRRKGPKKKLSWQTDDKLTQIRFFEIDLSERVNVSKQSFLEMKNLERYGERDALNIARRGFDDTMEPQIEWRTLVEVDNVPPHPNGSQSKQRSEQAAREMTTLRALYFSNQLIPDSPAEAEIEPHFAHDIPIIPLEDLTGNPDAINDFTSTPWPEPKGMAPSTEMLMGAINEVVDLLPASVPIEQNISVGNPFRPFGNNFEINSSKAIPVQQQMSMNLQQNSVPPGMWANQGGPMILPSGPMMGNTNPFVNPNMDLNSIAGNIISGPSQNGPSQNGPSQNGPFMNGPFNGPQFNMNTVGSFGLGPQSFNNINFGPMGQGPPMMNNMNGGPNAIIGQRNNRANSNSGGNWRSGGNNFQDNAANWRSAGSGPNNRGVSGNNTGVCKAFKRGHCRLGKSCKYVHPSKKRM